MTEKKRTIYGEGRIFVGRIGRGEDLLGRVTAILNEEEIRLGQIAVHGHLTRLVLSRHNPADPFAAEMDLQAPCDITVCSGTVSLFKRRALPQLAGLFVEPEGTLHAGTIRPGTIVHACEIVITELTGGSLSRDFDEETGLPLWKGAIL